MTKITEDLIRRRAEHNNCEISTLEEVSLHQQDIQRIEHIDKWCRELKILYLQSNLIPKIENVGRLKKLEYLNLALNNVEKIENLEGCESLKKLDLTVNFVGELTSTENLKDNYNLRELFLTGNPCTEFEGYRDYVIATLPQLQWLDGTPIEKSERIKAMQDYGLIKARILQHEEKYRKKRAKQKEDAEVKKKKEENPKPGFDGRWYTDISDGDQKAVVSENGNCEDNQDDKEKEFWDEKVPFTPESRLEVHQHMNEMKKKNEPNSDLEKEKKPRRLFAEDGRPLNINEAKVDFTLTEDDGNNKVVLDVACFKHMDTSLIDCDVQTTHVKVVLKGKIFQLCLPVEVNPDSSTAQRSQTTGHLLITMPLAKPILKPIRPLQPNNKQTSKDTKQIEKERRPKQERLEVDASVKKGADICNIVKEGKEKMMPPLGSRPICRQIKERPNSENFKDDPDVPPLM